MAAEAEGQVAVLRAPSESDSRQTALEKEDTGPKERREACKEEMNPELPLARMWASRHLEAAPLSGVGSTESINPRGQYGKVASRETLG